MSQILLYQPQEPALAGRRFRFDDAEPRILSFAAFAGHRRSRVLNIVARARAIHANRTCPHCDHPVVMPLELENAVMNRSRMPIPGTATLVGFRCESCQSEWPVSG